MTVVFLIISVIFFCITFDHLFISDVQRDRGMNGFLMCMWLHNIATNATKLLS